MHTDHKNKFVKLTCDFLSNYDTYEDREASINGRLERVIYVDNLGNIKWISLGSLIPGLTGSAFTVFTYNGSGDY